MSKKETEDINHEIYGKLTIPKFECKSVSKKGISKKDLEKINLKQLFGKENPIILSLVRSSGFHYEMIMALQQQIICLEGFIKAQNLRIKLLEEKLR